jgi:Virulence factor membrane-bound polymerase, C-terminal/O-Antigen ligase/Protein glycosylation ligase
VRQPNHLATLLLLGAVGLVALAQTARARWPAVTVLMGLLVFGVVLSASRTGLWFGVPLLVLWGALDRSLDRRWRVLLLLTPLLALLAWGGMHVWAQSGAGVFGAETRLDSEGAGSPSRVKILLNAWALLQQQPLTGVGFGDFNRAWTLTPFPDRPVAFFDHTHNLPLQILVELGWPLGLLVLGLLTTALLTAVRNVARTAQANTHRAPLVMTLVVLVHSLLEYPLWYAYFLLPTALALGLALSRSSRHVELAVRRWPVAVGALMVAGSVWALHEYRFISAIYAPSQSSAPLAQRIARGQSTWLFSLQADYAAATALGANTEALAAAQRTGHQLIDVRLMMAWAKSLQATGQTDKARYLVERLREFHSREGTAWLQECEEDPSLWMCHPAQGAYTWRDF